MGIKLEFREQDKIIYFQYEDPWSVADIKRVNEEAMIYLDKATEDMNILVNVERIRQIPSGILRARNVPTLSHPRCARHVIFGASTFVRSLSETIFRVTRYEKAIFFNTETEAMKYIQESKVGH